MSALSQKASMYRPSPAPIMRLVRDEAIESSPRERRIFPRREMQATVMGKRLDHTVIARRQPALALNLRDLSLGGLSALTDMPLIAGERIAVTFPQQGLKMGWSACGHVIRCEPSALGYRVAVEFEQLPTAA